MIAATLGIAVLAFVGFWFFGSVLLRVAGLLLILIGAIGLVATRDLFAGLITLAIGLVLWLAGHWHYALRHHEYASSLAQRIFQQALPDRLDPTQGWSWPVHAQRGRRLRQRR